MIATSPYPCFILILFVLIWFKSSSSFSIDRFTGGSSAACPFYAPMVSYVAFVITKTYLYNFDPLKPHVYIVKLGYTLFFLFLLKNMDCGYVLEPPRRGGSKEYSQSMFRAEIWKISEFLSENFQFLVVKFSIYMTSFSLRKKHGKKSHAQLII